MSAVYEHRLNSGGVYRCCISTLGGAIETDPAWVPADGERLPCLHCSSGLIHVDGVWRWGRDFGATA